MLKNRLFANKKTGVTTPLIWLRNQSVNFLAKKQDLQFFQLCARIQKQVFKMKKMSAVQMHDHTNFILVSKKRLPDDSVMINFCEL